LSSFWGHFIFYVSAKTTLKDFLKGVAASAVAVAVHGLTCYNSTAPAGDFAPKKGLLHYY
jgi:hypothetical protein